MVVFENLSTEDICDIMVGKRDELCIIFYVRKCEEQKGVKGHDYNIKKCTRDTF